jgi:glycosyltransferase involved in cell wall biosynthesis
MTRIAICLASYEGAAYIGEQISSIVAQLLPGDKIYLSDDGSHDETVAIATSLSDDVVVVATSRVGGVVPNFERALSAAFDSGAEQFVLCDQDDVWLPGRLAQIRSELAKADLVLLNGLVVDAQLVPLGATIAEAIGVRHGFWQNLGKNSYIGCCMAFRRNVLELALPFYKGIPWHDWYLGLLAERFFVVSRVQEPTMYYRRHGANHSPTGEKSRYSLAKKIGMRITMLRAVLHAGQRRSA